MRALAKEATISNSMLMSLAGNDTDKIGTAELATAFSAGDELGVHVATTAANVLGSAIANAVTLLSIDTVVIGGGITEALGEPWVELVRTQFQSDVFPPQAAEWCRLLKTELESDAGMIGAAMLAVDVQ